MTNTHASINGNTGEIYDITNFPDDYQWLDDIFEDLIVGHNFEYAREAIRKHMAAERIEEF